MMEQMWENEKTAGKMMDKWWENGKSAGKMMEKWERMGKWKNAGTMVFHHGVEAETCWKNCDFHETHSLWCFTWFNKNKHVIHILWNKQSEDQHS